MESTVPYGGGPLAADPVIFETHPSRYRHWNLSFEGEIARLVMSVQEDAPLVPEPGIDRSRVLCIDVDRR